MLQAEKRKKSGGKHVCAVVSGNSSGEIVRRLTTVFHYINDKVFKSFIGLQF